MPITEQRSPSSTQSGYANHLGRDPAMLIAEIAACDLEHQRQIDAATTTEAAYALTYAYENPFSLKTRVDQFFASLREAKTINLIVGYTNATMPRLVPLYREEPGDPRVVNLYIPSRNNGIYLADMQPYLAMLHERCVASKAQIARVVTDGQPCHIWDDDENDVTVPHIPIYDVIPLEDNACVLCGKRRNQSLFTINTVDYTRRKALKKDTGGVGYIEQHTPGPVVAVVTYAGDNNNVLPPDVWLPTTLGEYSFNRIRSTQALSPEGLFDAIGAVTAIQDGQDSVESLTILNAPKNLCVENIRDILPPTVRNIVVVSKVALDDENYFGELDVSPVA